MKRLRTAPIRTQILVLALLLIVLVSAVAVITEPFIYGRHDKGIEIGLLAGRVERVVDQFRQARSPDEEQAALSLAAGLGMSVEKIPASRIPAQDAAEAGSLDIPGRIRRKLESGFFESVEHLFDEQAVSLPLAVKVDAERALLFQLPVFPRSLWFFPAVASGILKLVIPLALLAYFSSWLITRPLMRFAAAAERASTDDSLKEPFVAEGAAEVRSLAASLNVMRSRILRMAESRTRMLSSISHDLRTPLTRLRMRVERCEGQPELQRKMLEDLTVLDSMINESLAFLTNALHNVPSRKVDLSSLLQTIATDFSEAGIDVSYSGPRRLKYVCKPQSLTRAVSNLVENASRYATKIDIELEDAGDRGVFVRVSDNGPGLTDKLKARVLEPFFKADEARTPGASGGFGLGLPTAEGIVRKGHGGTLTLRDNTPTGLVVEINLPPIHDNGSGRLSSAVSAK
ncbi:HAMP domain-containing histidine kinase [Rhizobiaceae bacterium BDR2-2]|uniref:histidine kinase n=1 Tax=Ectorhizobium quercum TaxID=2965071 RepID=A0AAE3MYR1_9HYPH|nr:HAMP domain-containing sensor histidine kinase [Ectorhizobium quercum]MCX8997498.1 HAMP domain-containing histidine kinase [Ectorhizobium quercum]